MRCEVCPVGSASHAAMSSVARMVAQCGTSFEDVVRQRNQQDPNLWFLFNKNSPAYRQYQEMVEQFKCQLKAPSPIKTEYKPDDLYDPTAGLDDPYPCKTEPDDHVINRMDDACFSNFKQEINDSSIKNTFSYNQEQKYKVNSDSDPDNEQDNIRKSRKRKSRWGDQTTSLISSTSNPLSQSNKIMLTKVTRTDPALIQYAVNSFGTANLSEDEWQKAEDHYKINLLYQDMLRKREEVNQLQESGKFKYEYDSDEETDGGTWEHKIRVQEMEATKLWATELTKKAEGKHHIGDFLPPEELRRFMEQSTAAKEGREPDLSDYKEYKLNADNIGFQMLQKLGWSEGQGLGIEGSGIVEPVNKAAKRDMKQGLGVNVAGGFSSNDDEYDAYRKRMMLAYRFRPNPLNNPRRPYY